MEKKILWILLASWSWEKVLQVLSINIITIHYYIMHIFIHQPYFGPMNLPTSVLASVGFKPLLIVLNSSWWVLMNIASITQHKFMWCLSVEDHIQLYGNQNLFVSVKSVDISHLLTAPSTNYSVTIVSICWPAIEQNFQSTWASYVKTQQW